MDRGRKPHGRRARAVGERAGAGAAVGRAAMVTAAAGAFSGSIPQRDSWLVGHLSFQIFGSAVRPANWRRLP